MASPIPIPPPMIKMTLPEKSNFAFPSIGCFLCCQLGLSLAVRRLAAGPQSQCLPAEIVPDHSFLSLAAWGAPQRFAPDRLKFCPFLPAPESVRSKADPAGR